MMQSDKTVDIQAQIQLLSDLQARLQSLRHIPASLLKTPVPNALDLSAPMPRSEFQLVKEIGDIIRTEPIQDALRSARDSLRADGADLNPNLRRENRKRRRAPSPESPKPYIPAERRSTSLFPLAADNAPALHFEGLSTYIRVFNSSHSVKLHLWRRTHSMTHAGGPTIIRVTIPDVLTAYVTAVREGALGGRLLTESVTVFGPRERKSPHSQSEFVVYRAVSQQVGKMLESDPLVAVERVVDLLCSYLGLFVERCGSCERVLSTEGHVPAVVRVWKDEEGWCARHVGCRVD